MTRNNKTSMKHCSFYLPLDIVKRLEKDADEISISKSTLLRSILEAHYDMAPSPSIPQHRPHRELEKHIKRIVQEAIDEETSNILNIMDEKLNQHQQRVAKLVKQHLDELRDTGHEEP